MNDDATARPSRDGNRQPEKLYLRLQSANVFVRNLEKSVQFYLEKLGFEVAFDVITQSGQRWVGVAPPDGTAVLILIEPAPESQEYELIGRPTQITFVTEDVAAKYGEWHRRGVRFQHSPRLRRIKYQQLGGDRQSEASIVAAQPTPVWGGVFTRFEDPDRNSFGLVSLDEINHAIEAQRRLAAEQAEAERRAARELEIAKEVQLKLFPQSMPLLNSIEYAGVCIQAQQVGGDYYDFLSLGHGHMGMVLADISGKGIAAALLMANLQANLRSLCAIAADQPQRLLRSVNQLFCDNTTDGAFATLFFAEYNDATRGLRYANCGHLPALLLRCDDSLARLESTATILGVFKKWDCSISEIQIAPGDIFALYTDGITESFNEAGEEFGEERLAAALCRHRALSSHDLLAAIVDEVHKFSPREQHDDITLIIAKSV